MNNYFCLYSDQWSPIWGPNPTLDPSDFHCMDKKHKDIFETICALQMNESHICLEQHE